MKLTYLSYFSSETPGPTGTSGSVALNHCSFALTCRGALWKGKLNGSRNREERIHISPKNFLRLITLRLLHFTYHTAKGLLIPLRVLHLMLDPHSRSPLTVDNRSFLRELGAVEYITASS